MSERTIVRAQPDDRLEQIRRRFWFMHEASRTDAPPALRRSARPCCGACAT